jgi:hypothetical protein
MPEQRKIKDILEEFGKNHPNDVPDNFVVDDKEPAGFQRKNPLTLDTKVSGAKHYKYGDFVDEKDPWVVRALTRSPPGPFNLTATDLEMFLVGSYLKKNIEIVAKILETIRCFLQCEIFPNKLTHSPPYHVGVLKINTPESKNYSGTIIELKAGKRFADDFVYTDDQLFCALIFLMQIKAIPTGGIGLYQLDDKGSANGERYLRYDIRGISSELKKTYGEPNIIDWSKIPNRTGASKEYTNWVRAATGAAIALVEGEEPLAGVDGGSPITALVNDKNLPDDISVDKFISEVFKNKTDALKSNPTKGGNQNNKPPLNNLVIYSYDESKGKGAYIPNPFHLAQRVEGIDAIEYKKLLKNYKSKGF